MIARSSSFGNPSNNTSTVSFIRMTASASPRPNGGAKRGRHTRFHASAYHIAGPPIGAVDGSSIRQFYDYTWM